MTQTPCHYQDALPQRQQALLTVLIEPLLPIPPQAHLRVDPSQHRIIIIVFLPPQQNMLPRTPLVMLLLAVLAVLLQPLPGRAANPKAPHPHKGVLEVIRQERCDDVR